MFNAILGSFGSLIKIACNIKTASRTVKRSEICDSGVAVTYIWGTVGLLLLKVIWGHSVHWFTMAFKSKTVDRRVKRNTIWDSGVLVTCTWGIFDLLVFTVILGSFGALASNGLLT